MEWHIYFYNEQVKEQIATLPKCLKARCLALLDRMRSDGANLGSPHTESIGDGLFELRVKAQEGIARAFFCTLVDKKIVILHSFIKKTQKTPKKELDLAKWRLKEVKKDDKR